MDHPMVLGIILLTIWDFITTHGILHIITDHLFILDLAWVVMVVDTLTIHLIIIHTTIIGTVTIKVTRMAIMLPVAIMAMDTIHITGPELRTEGLTSPLVMKDQLLPEYQIERVHLKLHDQI